MTWAIFTVRTPFFLAKVKKKVMSQVIGAKVELQLFFELSQVSSQQICDECKYSKSLVPLEKQHQRLLILPGTIIHQ